MMRTSCFFLLRLLLLSCAALAGLTGVAAAQPAPLADKITIGIYAPTVEFGAAQARLAYVQGLAKAIEQNTGVKTEAQSYANIAALKKDAVDFAIIDGVCYATNLGWKLLATATIGGGTTRPWALYSSAGETIAALKGKKLAFIATGCNDAGFVDNAMLESEVDPAFFGARNGKSDLTAAIAEVASYKAAQAVFAPAGAAKGLTKVFDTGTVPNPAFVDVSGKLPGSIVERVAAAVLGYGGSGAIAGWTKPSREIYTALAGRLGKVNKSGILANAEPVRFDAKDALIEPATLKETAVVDVRHHFVRPSGGRME
jgi:ABC-type phosphate/phosphonate transport system substrate-binding protein